MYVDEFTNARNLDINVYVLDYHMNVLDEISGLVISANQSLDSDSDIRRVIDVSMGLKRNGISTTPKNIDYWKAGNPYWFDKYLKIEVVANGVPMSQGVYLINAPSITYDATNNTLSFQALDLMSKLTGARNGYLEGMAYQIPAGSNVVEAIRSLLLEQGFSNMILDTPPINQVPADINIDIGSTAYDMLTQLNDINPNWEMFFDVNGVFRFQQIPSGADEVAQFGDEIWDNVCLNYNMDTDFESVKNYVEIIGKQVEPDETGVATYSSNVLTLKLGRPISSYTPTSWHYQEYSNATYYKQNDCVAYNGGFYRCISQTQISGVIPTDTSKWESFVPMLTWYIGFALGAVTTSAELLDTPIDTIVIKDSANVNVGTITIPNDQEAKIYYLNESYFIKMRFSNNGYVEGEFGGYLQPKAIAFETNPESPFYVGEAKRYLSQWNKVYVDFVEDDYSDEVAEMNVKAVGNTITIDATSIISSAEFANAPITHQWAIKVDVSLDNNTPVERANIYWGGTEGLILYTSNNERVEGEDFNEFVVQSTTPKKLLNQYIYKSGSDTLVTHAITLDFNQEYLIVLTKTMLNTLTVSAKYYPISASHWQSPTTKIHSVPKFSKMVRGVYSGDEYDNIYSNNLALQRAKYNLYLYCRLHDTISITNVPLYWLDVNKLFEFSLKSSDLPIKWITKSINTDYGVEGTQSITAMRYYPLYLN